MSRRHQHQQLCPTPSKRAYYTLEELREAFEEDLVLEQRRAYNFILADQAYRCRCLRWHRTKRTDRPGTVSLR